MSFILEVVKNGKDIICFNSCKYRESYSLKCGDIVWKCLGRSCKASVKTNKEKTIIYASNETHTGQHPVTLRSLTPTQTACGVSPTTPGTEREMSQMSQPKNTPQQHRGNMDTPASVKFNTNNSEQEESRLRAENDALREELARIREEKKMILDHSIESDLRLLKYTDDVFPSPQSLRLEQESDVPYTCNQATQTDFLLHSTLDSTTDLEELTSYNKQLKIKLENSEKKVKELETLVKGLSSHPCEKCQILKEDSKNMITSIRCLEEEIKSLKQSLPTKSYFADKNKFDILVGTSRFDDESDLEEFKTVVKKQKKINLKKNTNINTRKNKTVPCMSMKTSIRFENVSILGDSHVRHLSAMVKNLVQPKTMVSGMCKPNAGLLNIVPTNTPPPKHCYVLMGGTNDVAAGKEINIFSRLESVLQKCLPTSNMLLVPLPSRHDLPRDSPVHRTVQVVNQFMSDLCGRYMGVDLLDTSIITRRHFTSHGLHMRASGKQLLARLIVTKLARSTPSRNPPSRRPAPISPLTSTSQASTQNYKSPTAPPSRTLLHTPVRSVEPFTLPHDTFADAVKGGLSPETRGLRKQGFLEIPLRYHLQK